MNDCSLVATQGLSYQEIVEEHLSTNPSLETSKSSVELEKAVRAESFSVKNEKTEFSSVRAGAQTTSKSSDSGSDKKPSALTESPDVNAMPGAKTGQDVGDVDLARPQQTFTSSVTSQSRTVHTIKQRQTLISGLTRGEDWRMEEPLQQQESQTLSQTTGGLTTSSTSNYENSHSSQQSHIQHESGATTKNNNNYNIKNNNDNNNNNKNNNQKSNSGSSDSSDSSEMVVVAAVETQVPQVDKMSYVSSAKEKEKKTGVVAPDIRTSEVSGQFNYKDFLSGVEDIAVRGEREEAVGLTSTPRDSVRGRAKEVVVGVTNSPRESTSSTMSNEEIVRSHLTKFTQVNITVQQAVSQVSTVSTVRILETREGVA